MLPPQNKFLSWRKYHARRHFNLIQKIPTNKASGLDKISARLVKEASPIVTRSLTFTINLSITTGIFPNAWKRASLTQIFKRAVSRNSAKLEITKRPLN